MFVVTILLQWHTILVPILNAAWRWSTITMKLRYNQIKNINATEQSAVFCVFSLSLHSTSTRECQHLTNADGMRILHHKANACRSLLSLIFIAMLAIQLSRALGNPIKYFIARSKLIYGSSWQQLHTSILSELYEYVGILIWLQLYRVYSKFI